MHTVSVNPPLARVLVNCVWREVPLIRAVVRALVRRDRRSSFLFVVCLLTGGLSVTGYATFCFLPAVHFITHRLAPVDLAPISSRRNSNRSSSRRRPAAGCIPPLYLGVALHAVDEIRIILSTWTPGLKLPRQRARCTLAGAAVAAVLTGLANPYTPLYL
ncbi:hypothetical protein EDB83DRAFT_1354991 [Lactarius deliciosus]|nr:hypothetical protein EDB83DRAFT_1354991 [Lactarius deliciosus]